MVLSQTERIVKDSQGYRLMVAKFSEKVATRATGNRQQPTMTHSRLGQILINRGYIQAECLAAALRQQQTSDSFRSMRLGELLIAQGLLTPRELKRALRQQSRLRLAAYVVAAVSAPLAPAFAMASVSTTQIAPPPKTSFFQNHSELKASGHLMLAGLKPMADSAMEAVSARGLVDEDFGSQKPVGYDNSAGRAPDIENAETPKSLDGIKVLKGVGSLLNPLTQVLNADIDIAGVHVSADRIKPLFDESGAMNVTLPNLIERVSFRDIRPAGQVGGPTFGTVQLEGIRFHDNASIKIRPF